MPNYVGYYKDSYLIYLYMLKNHPDLPPSEWMSVLKGKTFSGRLQKNKKHFKIYYCTVPDIHDTQFHRIKNICPQIMTLEVLAHIFQRFSWINMVTRSGASTSTISEEVVALFGRKWGPLLMILQRIKMFILMLKQSRRLPGPMAPVNPHFIW